MKEVYFTLTGTCFHFGPDILEKGMEVMLEKEPDSEYDTEAIKVTLPGLGAVGHVANSVRTRIGESWSAGRIYDKIPEKTEGKVMYITPKGILCSVMIAE